MKHETKFRRQVFKIVKRIPNGKVMNYKAVAKLAGRPRAWRAVGNILNKNQYPIEIPCHRVIISDGRVGGYIHGARKKTSLLKKEGVVIKNWRTLKII